MFIYTHIQGRPKVGIHLLYTVYLLLAHPVYIYIYIYIYKVKIK